jgi:lysozyme
LGTLLIIVGTAIRRAGTSPATPSNPVPEPAPLPAPVASPPPLDLPPAPSDGLTARGAAELVGHEAIVCEAYLDSEGVWTWGIGVTDASGHTVERYIDHPAPIGECLAVFVWLLREKYLPAVEQAFAGFTLTEAQLSAALSFHYNTGAILHASWVSLWKSSHIDMARSSFMDWNRPASIVGRRQAECNLFFDGKWSSDGKATVFPVLKPSYRPNFAAGTRVDVLTPLKALIGQ